MRQASSLKKDFLEDRAFSFNLAKQLVKMSRYESERRKQIVISPRLSNVARVEGDVLVWPESHHQHGE